MEINGEKLLAMAREAKKEAYAPYSGFAVGAALLTKEGKIYTGCNIENASFGATNCAERTAFFKAISEGQRHFAAIAIAGGPKEGPEKAPCVPCGICRQVMMEFCDAKTFCIYLSASDGGVEEYRLEELLPAGFGPGDLT